MVGFNDEWLDLLRNSLVSIFCRFQPEMGWSVELPVYFVSRTHAGGRRVAMLRSTMHRTRKVIVEVAVA